ncbi:hypothetical protein [Sutcliffiella halmapala]|uniref:hypothetical protein n=1 Tax=Sutcliffiella halmapala TaxID=79882 RepID=UPI0009955BF1|nr:hypothetical protein [Sutcliffiella halmapala]
MEGYSGILCLLGVVILLFVLNFYIQVSDLKKVSELSTKEAMKKGLKSMSFLAIVFGIIIIVFLGIVAYLRFFAVESW